MIEEQSFITSHHFTPEIEEIMGFPNCCFELEKIIHLYCILNSFVDIKTINSKIPNKDSASMY